MPNENHCSPKVVVGHLQSVKNENKIVFILQKPLYHFLSLYIYAFHVS